MRCTYRLCGLSLIIISSLVVGCRPLNPSPPVADTSDSSTAEPATATPIAVGLSRERPLANTATISLPNWDVNVLEVVRAPTAWERLREANQFNEPAPEDWNYLLIKYRLHRKGNSSELNSLGLHLTGSANILHYSFNTSAVPPEPVLDPYLVGGETREGWEAYLVHEDESDLMLVLDDYSDYEQLEHFVSLNEKAQLTVPDTLAAIEATAVGRDLNEPIPFGQLTTSDDWQMTLWQIERGESAWRRLYEANSFNTPPEPGQSYLLVQVWVHYIGTHPLGEPISSWDFDVINRDQEIIHNASVSSLENLFPYVKLYPDGEFTGWIAFLVDSGDDSLTLTFKPMYSVGDNRRYFSLQQSGR